MADRSINDSFISLIENTGRTDYIYLDLSISNLNYPKSVLQDPELMHDRIREYLKKNDKSVAYGGYLEKRSLYDRSEHFKSNIEQRNIHLGLDLWCESDSNIVCPQEGKIHSFKNNKGFGDYGPTIILEHRINKNHFYTLYGHVSLESIRCIKVGDKVNKGDVIAKIGGNKVNGNYAPHLHFQVINNIENNKGDYPGVCADSEISYYKENCPDPELFLAM